MHSFIRPLQNLAVALLLTASALHSQSGTPQSRYNLERWLFASPDVELKQRPNISVRIGELQASLPGSTGSAAALLRTLVLMDSVAAVSKRHSTYLYLRSQTNTLDRASTDAQSVIDAQARGAANRVRATLTLVDKKRLDRYIVQEPRLAAYRFAIVAGARYAPHSSGPEKEGVLSRMVPLASDWPLDLYDRAMSRIAFGTVASPNGPLDVYRQRGAIANSPDTLVRKEGIRRLWEGFNSQRDLFAASLIGTVRARTAIAKERKFASAPAEVYFRAFLAPADVKALIARVRARADLSKRYQRILAARAAWIATQTGRVPVRIVPIALDSASALIKAALAPLGTAYQSELAALLDPANGRLDVRSAPNRAGGGASFGGGVCESGVYLSVFEGFPADVSRFAHEAGHGVENQFHFARHISPAYANGTANMVGADFLSESYAQFNELVLADTMLKRATNDGERQIYLMQFLTHALEPFYGAQDAELEQAIYDGVTAGRITNADQLDSLTSSIDRSYDITSQTRPELRARWIQRRVMIEDPVYYFNFMYSGILSLKFFERYTADRARFAPRYVDLVANGYQNTPTAALKASLGIDVADSRLLDDAIGLIEVRIAEVEALFARLQARVIPPPQ